MRRAKIAAAAWREPERPTLPEWREPPPAPEPFEGCTEAGEPAPLGPLTFDDIRRVVCEHYNVPWQQVRSERREHKYMVPRHVIAWLAYTRTLATFPLIGRMLGRDHSTILHAVAEAVPKRMERDPAFAATVRLLRAKLEDGR
jgi:chromosomal replication initiation ATPase DnaA